MRVQDRRLKELEAKEVNKNGPILIIREMFIPSKDGPVSANEYYGSWLGLACSTHSVPGESIENFERRLMEAVLV